MSYGAPRSFGLRLPLWSASARQTISKHRCARLDAALLQGASEPQKLAIVMPPTRGRVGACAR
eukprot:3438335-Alexandrium_andersonii.AAC.1